MECGPVGSYDAVQGASCTCIEPMRLEESLGQNRGEVYDARPSMEESYEKKGRL